jgi:superkiller protein 3
MLRGLALTHLKRKEEAEKVGLRFGSYRKGADEKCYILAYRIQPSNPLAIKGIPKFYSEIKNWEKLGRFYESRVQQTYNE